MNWYLIVLKKYADFSRRASRSEYWFFILFNAIFAIAAVILDLLLGTFSLMLALGVVSGLYSLAMFIPSLAVTVRRLHDTNRTGWWVLIGLIPLAGAIVLLIFTIEDSNQGANKYGSNPKSVTA